MTTDVAERIKLGDSRLARRLRGAIAGDVLFDRFSRGRHATDASIYQIEPVGVVVPRHRDDVAAVIDIAANEGVAVLPRGGGTSQCGQTVGRALVVDMSKHFNQVTALNPDAATVSVEPGLVLDQLNATLRPHGLMFPVDVSTANRATIGGMAGNNSCGARSIRYGNMVHNVRAIDAILSDGAQIRFGSVPGNLDGLADAPRYAALVQDMRALHAREADEIAAKWPKLLRRVGGYNIDSIASTGHNMADLLVGSEGTLGFFTEIELDLKPIPPHTTLGVCHFPSLHQAMAATRQIVTLDPDAVELADRTMIDLARDRPLYRNTIERFVRGEPAALLLVEFTGETEEGPRRQLRRLVTMMADLGFPGAVVEAHDKDFQKAVWDVRKAALNIMMSMKGDGKPVSFIEDCAVSLEDLPDYTDRLTQLFAKHGTTGTWYAHASVGCLHVRPILNMKDPSAASTMRAIAEEAFAIVREYQGAHSGEHGDGIVRSEFHEEMFGSRLARAFETVKDRFDPAGLFNPGKIVRPERMDDRSLFRYGPAYRPRPHEAVLDWSEWGGFLPAVEMCNNNGACRKASAGVMCPSFRATGDEQHVTRGRANTLRLALSGQLGPDALRSDGVAAAFDLCLSCKGCRRECPTGVDMARMKIEVAHARRQVRSPSLRDRLIGFLPRYASWASRFGPIINRLNGLAWLRRLVGFAHQRPLPRWHVDPFKGATFAGDPDPDLVLFVDTFNCWFSPDVARAAVKVLRAAGYRVAIACGRGRRPLCCGRTFLSAGMIDDARREMRRSITALAPYAVRGLPIVGLEPSCLFTLRDELVALLPGPHAQALADHAVLFDQFVANERRAGRFDVPLRDHATGTAVAHTHCHQKAFEAADATADALDVIPNLDVQAIGGTCCGMAGAFGYEAEHYDLSMRIGALDVLPRVAAAGPKATIVANGISCRHQIADGTGRSPKHVAEVLAAAIDQRA